MKPLARWRLVLGEAAGETLGGLDAREGAQDAALSWLYDREHESDDRDIRARGSGGGPGGLLTVPRWIEEVQTLFPKETIERLEHDAVARYRIDEVVTDPEVLARVEPNTTLLEAVLRTKHLMNPEVLAMARALVAKVIRALIEKLAKDVRRGFSGVRDRRRRSNAKRARDFDAKATLRANLSRWSPQEKRLYVTKPLFSSRIRRHALRWQIVLLVDQSGSMLSSVIHSAVTAACLWGLPSIKTHLVAWDTEIVDLTDRVVDPVEALMKVQLGGGNDGAKAVAYARQLLEAPRRSIVVLVSDFFEGGGAHAMVRNVRAMCEEGVTFLALAALDDRAVPAYDHDVARMLAEAGAHVGAMTPGELVSFLAEKVRA